MPLLTSEMYLQDDQLKAIGCMEVETSLLDNKLDDVIKRICGFNGDMFNAFIYPITPIGAKLKMLRAIVIATCADQNCRNKFDVWHSKVTTELEKRNTVIHGKWTARIGIADVITQDSRKSDSIVKRKRTKSSAVKSADIMSIAHQIYSLRLDLFEMFFGDPILTSSPSRYP
jgi:hypothetical protein